MWAALKVSNMARSTEGGLCLCVIFKFSCRQVKCGLYIDVVFPAVYQRLEAAASSPVLHRNECSLLEPKYEECGVGSQKNVQHSNISHFSDVE